MSSKIVSAEKQQEPWAPIVIGRNRIVMAQNVRTIADQRRAVAEPREEASERWLDFVREVSSGQG